MTNSSADSRIELATDLQKRYEKALRERDAAESSSMRAMEELDSARRRVQALTTERDHALAQLQNINRDLVKETSK